MGSDRRVSFRLVRGELLHLEVAVAAQESHCTSVKNIGAQFDKMAEQLADILAQPDPTNAAAPPKPVTLPAMEDEPRPREATSYQDYDPFAPAPPTKSAPQRRARSLAAFAAAARCVRARASRRSPASRRG
jgi:hypothetical protein